MAMTLWDLIEPVAKALERRKGPPREVAPPKIPPPQLAPRVIALPPPAAKPVAVAPRARTKAGAKPDAMQAKYDAVVREMLETYGIRVRKWRTSMSGVAWTVTYTDGKVSRLIESPRPKGPMSAAVFLHEIGHHAIGLSTYKPRCLEEYHAWAWSLRQMEASGLNVTDAVRRRMHESLHYAVAKAVRRGIKAVPPELEPFMQRPARRRKRRASSGAT